MKKFFTPILSSVFSITMLASCGNVDGVTKNSLSSKDISLSNTSFWQKGSFNGNFGKQKSPITLTADQQTQLKVLQDEEKKHFDAQKDNMTKIQDLFKTAFTSDTINKDDLKAKVTALNKT